MTWVRRTLMGLAVACVAALPAVGQTHKVKIHGHTPPVPNPAAPVDCVAWVNEVLGKEVEPGARDAFKAFEKEFEYGLFEPTDSDPVGGLHLATRGPWSDQPEMSRWLAKHEPWINRYRALADSRGFYVPAKYDRSLAGGPRVERGLWNAVASREELAYPLSQALIAQGYQRWGQGDRTLLPENALAVLAVARQLRDRSPSVLQSSRGSGCSHMAYRAIRKCFEIAKDPNALGVRLSRKLSEVDPPVPSFATVVELSRLVYWDYCQRLYVPGESKGQWWLCMELAESKGLHTEKPDGSKQKERDRFVPAELVLGAFDVNLKEGNAIFDATYQWADAPFFEAGGRLERLKKLKKEATGLLAKVLPHDLCDMRESHERLFAHRRATHLIAHIFAHRAKAGEFPRTLDELRGAGIA